MQRFARPGTFLKIAARVQPIAATITIITIAAGLYLGLFASPADYQQGEAVRIIYVHVPAAWMAMFSYTNLAIASAVGLIWKHPLADVFAKSAAPVGAAFTLICLVSGSLWGKPMWGSWWVWDARLTSVLVLFFLYCGHMVLTEAFDDPQRGAKASAILALVGIINVPIIKFSVDWWNTLHQPASISRLDAPAVHSSMLVPLLLMAVGFTTLFVTLVILRMRAELLARRIRALRLAEAGF
jgi:heme exporter protein C